MVKHFSLITLSIENNEKHRPISVINIKKCIVRVNIKTEYIKTNYNLLMSFYFNIISVPSMSILVNF